MTACDLKWPLRYLKDFENISVSIPRNFYQKRFINECARNKKAKIQQIKSFTVFLWDVKDLTFLITETDLWCSCIL